MNLMKLRIFTEPQQGASYATLRTVALAAEDSASTPSSAPTTS
jgi:hypothetical protein